MYYPSLFATLVLVACAVTPALSGPLPCATVPLNPARLADMTLLVTLTLLTHINFLSAEAEFFLVFSLRRPRIRTKNLP
jgi:hypothetical protein